MPTAAAIRARTQPPEYWFRETGFDMSRNWLSLVTGSGAFVAVLSVLAAAAPVSSAQAEIVQPFWDEKPNITGHRPRAAKRSLPTPEGRSASNTKAKAKRYASRGEVDYDPRPARRSVSGGVSWAAPSGCLNGTLQSVVADIAAFFGSVRVNSTCRNRGHNARVGGARRSHHLTGDAVDFRIFGNVSGALAFLRRHGSIGGIKHYGGGLIHADTGPRRSW